MSTTLKMEIKSRRNVMLLWSVLMLLHMKLVIGQLSNRAPHFNVGDGDMSRFSLPEDTPVGTPVYQLKGVDPEGGTLRYSISGPTFSVDRDTGVVRLRQQLDRETQDQIEVVISITDEAVFDSEPNTVSLRREIPVRDVNDNTPKFHGRPYRARVREGGIPGSVINVRPKVLVTDADGGVNSDVTVSCAATGHDACEAFDVDTVKLAEGRFEAVITLKRPLDFETRSSYLLTLKALDGGSRPKLSAFATVAIDVEDVQDQPPIFLGAPYSATIPENLPEDTSILQIMAMDGDVGNPRPILMTLEGDDLEYFALKANLTTGAATLVTTDVPIDREHPLVIENGGVYTFNVKATELINNEVPADSAISQINIVITDMDDHLPEFNKQLFEVLVPESLEKGTPLPGLPIVLTDDDLGINSRYDISLRGARHAFEVLPASAEGRTPIIIKVKDTKILDYDVEDTSKRTLEFEVIASVNGIEVASTQIILHIQDANDNSPIFGQEVLQMEVDENSGIGFKIADITAEDKDSGIYGEIEYSLKGFGSENFKTDRKLGGLFVNGVLDYERRKSYSLTLVAKDGGGRESTINLFVDVKDLNDNVPVFDALEYTRIIREGSTGFEPQFIIQATDLDGPTQGGNDLTYTIESENSLSGDVFSVHPFTGEILIRKPVSSADTTRGQYELTLRATDHGIPPLHNDTRVLVRVGIAGNQRPVFRGGGFPKNKQIIRTGPANYYASLREDATPGTQVLQVSASDPDGADAQLRYRPAGGEGRDNFMVEESTGVITVGREARLDRDSNPHEYALQIIAVDSGLPFPETATTTVFINITDVNNKPPHFNDSALVAFVSERAEIGQIVTRIFATDTDEDSLLNYAIIEPIGAVTGNGIPLKSIMKYDFKHAFRIDKLTGEISVNNTMDANSAAVIVLTLEARDVNATYNKEEQFDTTQISMYIQAYKDDNPVFEIDGWSQVKPFISKNIDEESPIGSVILTLNAKDGVNGKPVTFYRIIESNTDLVQINEINGAVSIAKRIDYEVLENNTLAFTVEAKSIDLSRSSIARINITVLNINDNAPVFEKKEYSTTVMENAKHPERVLTIKAVDADSKRTQEDRALGYGDVVFSLAGQHANVFTIDPISGIILIAPNKTLDWEVQSVLRFSVIARDSPKSSLNAKTSSAVVVIDVLDVNDNAPKFLLNEYMAVIPENVLKGTSVTNMTATDPDDGLGGDIRYDILDEGDANGLLEINSTTGEIKTKSVLTGKGRNEPYLLTVRAQDGGLMGLSENILYNDVSLILYIGDVNVNDGVPVFIKPAVDQPAFVSENATLGSPVFQAVASDPDDPSQPSGRLIYSIQDDTSDTLAFRIDPNSGLITTTRALDRETKDSYNLILVASDRGTPPQVATRVLKVKVTDVDDHTPRFQRDVDALPLKMSVKEEEPNGTLIGNFKAVDEDIGENGAIAYVIIDGNEQNLFLIDHTPDNGANLKSNGRLDREEASRHVLTIKCFPIRSKPIHGMRKQYNKLDPSEMQVVVQVEDIDDHLPVFNQQQNLTLGIRLNVPAYTSLLTVKASDTDAEAAPMNYTLAEVDFESPLFDYELPGLRSTFTLNAATGELRTAGKLVDFVDGFFRLTVRANNSAVTDRHSDLHIQLYIVRDRSLLRFVFTRPPREMSALLEAFTKDAQTALKKADVLTDGELAQDVKLHVYDTQVLVKKDQSLDFGSASSCFQLTRPSGTALTPGQMLAVLESPGAKAALNRVYRDHRVKTVEQCSTRIGARKSEEPTTAQAAVLAIALAIGLIAAGAAVSLCCMHCSYKRHLRKLRPPRRRFIEDTPGPSSTYHEPIYVINTGSMQHSSL